MDAGATSKPVKEYELSRYACYLIVQNGDPRKEVIALGQIYNAFSFIVELIEKASVDIKLIDNYVDIGTTKSA